MDGMNDERAGSPERDLDTSATLAEVLTAIEGLPKSDLLRLVEKAVGGGISVSFSGKANASGLFRKVRPRLTRCIKSLSAGTAEEQSLNRVIEGDNLQAMATLYRERGQVDLILTDPPYNTGKDFRYNDRWEEDPNDPGMGELISLDDGARHTKWMRFMLPRIQMMHAMLKPGGVLAICIDHRELFHLGPMLDEVFTERNRVAIINWQKSASRRNDQQHVSTATEYVLIYAKDKDLARTGLLDRTSLMDSTYKNRDADPEGPWLGVAPWGPSRATHMGMVYGVQNPFTGVLAYPPGSRCWAFEKATIKSWLEQWGSEYEERDLGDGFVPGLVLKGAKNPKTKRSRQSDPVLKAARLKAEAIRTGSVWPQLYFLKEGEGSPRKKTYIQKVKQGVVPDTFWADDDYDDALVLGPVSWPASESGTSEVGARELGAIVGDDHGFETVKPLALFEKVIGLWCPPGGLVLDPFAGSGTSAHAVLRLNQRQGTQRRFILIEQGRPEKGDPYASSLTVDRLKRVIDGNWKSGKRAGTGGGFEFLRLDKRIDAQALLNMEREEMVDTVIASHVDDGARRGPNLVRIQDPANKYLVARNDDGEGFYLIWGGQGKNVDFTPAVYDECANEAEAAGLKPVYHVYARLYLYQTENVRFYQIPDQILADFGLDLSSEPFTELMS